MLDTNDLIYEFLKTEREETLQVAVVGDILIDEYYEVSVSRISPEFPVPVMRSRNHGHPKSVMPGGAALTAWNLTPFNTEITLFGCADAWAAEQIELFGFDVEWEDNGEWSPRKRRFYDQDFALPRWDVENLGDVDGTKWQQARESLYNRIESYVEETEPDIIILSDYGKGLFRDRFAQDIIDLCNDLEIPTLVDPKHEPLSQWRRSTIFKPNQKEAQAFAEKHTDGYIDNLVEELKCNAVVVTDGGKGVYTYPTNAPKSHYTISKPISGHPLGYSGAGDCFAAVYAIAYAQGYDFREASIIAYNAAAVYVQNKYNNPATPHTIRKLLDPIEAKIFHNPGDLATVLRQCPGPRIFTNGCFDLLHKGHLHILQKAKELNGTVIVGVDSDDNVRRLKGKDRPIKPLDERMQVMASLQFVDFVTQFTGTPDKLISKLLPIRFLVKGGDHSADEVIGGDLVSEVVIVPTLEGASTTNTINTIKS